jgi:hypothetical protein
VSLFLILSEVDGSNRALWVAEEQTASVSSGSCRIRRDKYVADVTLIFWGNCSAVTDRHIFTFTPAGGRRPQALIQNMPEKDRGIQIPSQEPSRLLDQSPEPDHPQFLHRGGREPTRSCSAIFN